MDPLVLLALAVFGVLLSSAICSGSEAALFSVSTVKAKELADEKLRGAASLLSIRESMARPIAAIVILNNIANIGGSIAVGVLAEEPLGTWMGVFTGVLTMLVIVFSEIIPKTLGERHGMKISILVAGPILWITRLLFPVIWLIEWVTAPFTRGGGGGATTSEAEIKLLASIGQKEGVIERRESELIRRAFDLDKTSARDVMTPRVEMTTLESNASLAAAKTAILESQHNRIVVVGESVDDLRGVALRGELLAGLVEGRDTARVEEFVREPPCVPEGEPLDRLLWMFQDTRRHLAVVVDEYSGVSGVVTLEDVLEVLTGEIVDETDRAVDLRAVARRRGRQLGVEE